LSLVLNSRWINHNFFHDAYKRIDSYYPNSILAARGTPSAAELKLLDPWKKDLPKDVFGPAWVPPGIDDQVQQRMRLKQADQLLKKAGWIVKNEQRVRADDPARVFHFEIIVNSMNDQKLALQLASNLKRLGINVTIRYLDTAAFNKRKMDYDYDMTIWYWQNSLSPGSEQMAYWSCAAAKSKGSFNYPGICNPAIDALAANIANARTYDDLETDVHALDRALTWGWYMIPLFYSGEDDIAYRNTLAHPAKPPLYGFTFEVWWSKLAQDKKSANLPNGH
jgi:ABC-type oligopeptide transport system substrate-binding subunit